MKRLVIVLASALLMLLLTINAIGSAAARSPEAGGAPVLIVTPSEVTMLVPISTAAITTRHLFIDNVEENIPLVHDLLRDWLPQF